MKKKVGPKTSKKTSANAKKLATPKSNVRVRPKVATKTQPKEAYNKTSTWKTEQAASGNAARQEAKAVKGKNLLDQFKGKKKTVIKIRTGGGMGGMFNTKNR
jgi:hypothetical protein